MSFTRRRFDRLIPAYLEGALSDRRRRWFEAKLRASDECRAEVQVYRRLRSHVAQTDVEYPDSYAWQGFTAALRRRIDDAGHVDDAPTRDRRPRGLDIAAGAMGGAICGGLAALGVVYFGFSSGILPSLTPGATQDNLVRAAAMDAAFTSVPTGATLGYVGADGRRVRVTIAMDPTQLLRLLGAGVISIEQDTEDEWTELTPVLDSERTPVDLYGGNVLLVSSAR
jgi:anti-sigma factor RsiW